MAKTDFIYTDHSFTALAAASIEIPQKLSQGSALSKLTWEILNCRANKFTTLEIQGRSGALSLDQYALQKEMVELRSAEVHDKFINHCQRSWNLRNVDHLLMNSPGDEGDIETMAWENDFMGHTDAHRLVWVEKFRDSYCKKHPQDKKSCSVKKEDLVDLTTYHSLPLDERGRIMAQRVCKRFAEAPKQVQELMRHIAQSNCPGVLGASKSDL